MKILGTHVRSNWGWSWTAKHGNQTAAVEFLDDGVVAVVDKKIT
jgi:hypothetical protein